MIRAALLLLLSLAANSGAEEGVLFSRDIAPILQQKCFTCHNAEKAKGGYRVDTFANILKAGKSKNPSVVPSNPAQSELFKRLVTTDEDDRMPQDDEPLPGGTVELIRRWISAGAELDKGAETEPLAALLEIPAHPPAPEKYPFPVPVLALTFDSSGTELYVGGYNELTVWSVETGRLLRRIPGVIQRVHAILLDSSKNEFVVGGGMPGLRGEIAVHRLGKPEERKVLLNIGDEVLGITANDDGTLLAGYGSDHSIHLFQTDTKDKRLSIQQHADWVMNVNFSADSKRLVSASRDRTTRVYDTATGNLEATYMGHNAPVYAAAFTSDGNSVISGGRGKSLHIWKIADEKKSGELGGFGGAVHALLVLGEHVLSGCGDGMVREHSLSDKKLVRQHTMESPVFSLAHHRDANLIAAGTRSGAVKVWKWESGEEICSFVATP